MSTFGSMILKNLLKQNQDASDYVHSLNLQERLDPRKSFLEEEQMLLNIKQEASGWPEWVHTEEDAVKYMEEYALREDLSEGEEPGSEVTNHWCSVAYWELRQRVGRLYTLHEPYLCIFQDLPHGNGLSLSLVQEPTSVDCVKRTREKIGLGLVLSREADGVWLYNRSGYPVFVNSPTLDNPSSRASVVIKVNPGYSMNIFNYDMASVLRAVKERHCPGRTVRPDLH
uniref:MH2 domain-containing protein n=1 Tax=Magallana gigas TaxID=29159 RepID=A0A8W8NZD7_MAGGI